ncbi:unnamed protein product [Orchesella dallaii]|uniref:Tektin n=1 Tax=Orchesella dallaii TaxID=48710 RepID=A0ABP1Q608_9HEXA
MAFDKGNMIYYGKRVNQISYPGRFTEQQWSETNSLAHKSSQTERQRVENLLAESFRLADETEDIRQWNQQNVEYQFKKRIQDIRHWIEELDIKYNEIGEQIDDTGVYIKRLENASASIDPVVKIDKEILHKRENRIGIDLVNDEPQKQVLKELQLLQDSKEVAEKHLAAAKESLRLLRKFQFDLNKELKDKKMAMEVDTTAQNILEHSPHVQRQTPEVIRDYSHVRDEREWETLTKRYKLNADQLLRSSTAFRIEVESFLRLLCEELEKQVCNTNAAFEKRLWEIRSAKSKLEQEHLDVTLNIREMEDALDKLKKAFVEKESSLALTETRMNIRNQRPNLELVNDSLQRHLNFEAEQLKITMQRIQVQIQQTKLAFHKIQAHQMELEEAINVKINSIAIDETIIQPLRKQISIQKH